MTRIPVIEEKVRKLAAASSHEELLYKVLVTCMELFPILKAYLFRYTSIGYIAEGVISLHSTGELKTISHLRDDIRSSPIVYSAVHERTTKYCTDLNFFLQLNSRFIVPSEINSLVVIPICFGSVVLGFIGGNEFKEGTTFDDELLSSLTLYGKLVGNVIGGSYSMENTQLLSKREVEVMRRIAWGENSKEIAETINISELTVNQYAKSAIRKLGAQNRAQAVAELFRKGLIS